MRRHLLSPQGQFPAAGLVRRLAAMFYDSLLCIALMMVVTLLYQQVLLRLLYGSEQLQQLAREVLVGRQLVVVDVVQVIAHHRREDHLAQQVAVVAERMLVEVEDTGPGISEEVMSRLFQPFVTTKSGGMGIGLSISRRIIESHGGDLTVTRNKAGGATFTFTLPIMTEASIEYS